MKIYCKNSRNFNSKFQTQIQTRIIQTNTVGGHMLPDDDKTGADTIQPTHASRLTNNFLLLRKIRTSVIRTFSVKFELVFYEHLLLRAL